MFAVRGEKFPPENYRLYSAVTSTEYQVISMVLDFLGNGMNFNEVSRCFGI